jgi:hypothetical protein
MPIQLPELNRIEPQSTVSNAEIKAPALHGDNSLASASRALEGVGKELIDYQNTLAHQEADSIATQADNDLQMYHKEVMEGDPTNGKPGFQNKLGDPDKDFADVKTKMNDRLKELSANENWSPETQALVNRRLNKRSQELYIQTLTAWGNRKQKFDDEVQEKGVKLAQDGMNFAASFLDPEDATSTQMIRDKLNDINELVIAHAVKYGTASENESGSFAYKAPDGTVKKVVLTPVAEQKLRSSMADGVFKAWESVLYSDAPDAPAKAKMIEEQFGELLTASKRKDMKGKARAEAVKREALGLAALSRSIGLEAALKRTDDEEVRQKAVSFANTFDSQMEAMKSRRSTKNYKAAFKMMKERDYKSWTEAEADPDFVKIVSTVTSPQEYKGLQSQLEKKTISDPEAVASLNIISAGQDPNHTLETMDWETLSMYTSRLAPVDKRAWEGRWRKAHSPDGNQIAKQYTQGLKELNRLVIANDLISTNMYGKFQGDNATKFNKWASEFQEHLDSSDHAMKPNEIRLEAMKFVKQKLIDEDTTIPKMNLRIKRKTETKKEKDPTDLVPAWFGQMNDATKMQYILEWRKEKGLKTGRPSQKELYEFVEKRRRNR